ncbi:VOC family protein [Undibacterium fentianense]|uniref:VOC family protein n=1 Tax=Undibacterium fentianense TaxID=2828728 RepID=A0A941E1H5_9BURK|nr:VOC family protein [Undibacterium fentianense]MBR7799332.1 VOC family protein [Undibacterium fentianense]
MQTKKVFFAASILFSFALGTLPNFSAGQDTATKKPLLRAIDHIALNVKDLNASMHFYSTILGLEEIPAAAAGRKWLKINDGLQLHLLGERQLELVQNKNIHMAFRSSNLDELIQQLDAKQINWGSFRGENRTISASRNDGVRQIFFQDPDGYWIEVNDAK